MLAQGNGLITANDNNLVKKIYKLERKNLTVTDLYSTGELTLIKVSIGSTGLNILYVLLNTPL